MTEIANVIRGFVESLKRRIVKVLKRNGQPPEENDEGKEDGGHMGNVIGDSPRRMERAG